MRQNDITGKIIELGMKVHRGLGPGLLENAYKECLFFELNRAGLLVEKEVPMPLIYEGVRLDIGYRLDLLVEDEIVVELKSVNTLTDLHLAQIITYLKLGKFELGLLLNFNVPLFKDGIKRVINSNEAG